MFQNDDASDSLSKKKQISGQVFLLSFNIKSHQNKRLNDEILSFIYSFSSN